MKKVFVVIFLMALIACGCNITKDNKQTVVKTEVNKSIQSSNQSISVLKDITFEDQKQVEQLIKDYFTALEKKDYTTAWELTSSEQQKVYSKEDALKNHWGLVDIKFISIKGYLPSQQSAIGEVPPNTPTVYFIATLDIEPSLDSVWNKGLNDRFVNVLKESNGKWKIDGLATGP